MNFNLLTRCATPINTDKKNYQVKFHGGEFIEHIILCDNFILDSLFLAEIPHLISAFGIAPVIELIKSDFFKIRSETFITFGSTGRSSAVSSYRAKKGDLPLCSYCIDAFSIYPYKPTESTQPSKERSYKDDQKKFNSNNLKVVKSIQGMNKKDYKNLKKSIADTIVHFRSREVIDEISKQNYRDYQLEDTSIKYAISIYLRNNLNIDLEPEKIKLNINFIDDKDFNVSTNLKSLININIEEEHKILERSLLSICGINYNTALMREHNVTLGYRENEVDVLYCKILSQYINEININKELNKFRKILDIKNFPDLDSAYLNKQINLMKVLEIRDTKECVEFRNWINNQNNLDLNDLKDNLESVSQKIRDKLNTKTAYISKIAVSIGSSLIGLYNPLLGISSTLGLTALDMYLIEKFLSKKQHLTFLNNNLPSIYQNANN